MKIILTDEQFESLYDLIINDTEFLDYAKLHNFYVHNPFVWIPFIKQKYKLVYRTSEDEHSEIYYGSLYGTKARITMMLLRL